MNNARAIAEETARASYGRLIALLASRTRDIAAAEDALADAFAAALDHWPATGAPDSPEAWLLTAAKRKLIDNQRRAATRSAGEPALLLAIEEAAAMAHENRFVDERLKLLFICAHPAIEPASRTPLMLQTVLGLDATRIASAFLVAPTAMGQRLVRAKKKIAAAAIPFETPPAEHLPARAAAVLDAIYAAYGAGYDAAGDEGSSLAGEALFLARLVSALLASEAEAHGLHALLCYVEARASARRVEGVYMPLDQQDVSLWNASLIDEADHALGRAAALNAPGRYQFEAAIQSAHVSGRLGGEDTGAAVVRLYERLIAIAPSIGAEIGRAAALIKLGRADEAITALRSIDETRIAAHQPYWATIAHALAATGERLQARAAFTRAIGLSIDPAARDYLRDRAAELRNA